MRRTLVALSLAALFAPTAIGQDVASRRERFKLFNACKPMQLVVESLPSGATALGLTRESLQAAAESRLRAARLYTEAPEKADLAWLYVNVNVVGLGHNISVQYKKSVTDAFGISGFAPTWEDGSTGTQGMTGASFILSGLAPLLDKFLAAYLRVNEEACGSPVP